MEHLELSHALEEALGEPPYLALALLSTVMIAGWALKKFTGQPLLIGMMLMGFVLGPTGFGHVWPEGFHYVFTPLAMVFIGAISRMGLTFYQGITGFDFDYTKLMVQNEAGGVDWKKTRQSLMVPTIMSLAGIAATFAGGVPASWYLYDAFCDKEKIQFVPFALYTSAALSISSIVTIGYILKKEGLGKSAFGAKVMAAVLIGDVIGWLIVCCVDAYARSGDISVALPQMGIILGFIAVMVAVIRPILSRVMPESATDPKTLGLVVVFTLLTAWICHGIGIHPLFGSFVLGAIMPKTMIPTAGLASGEHPADAMNYSDIIAHRLEYFEEVFFLPIFLGFSGLRTNLWTLLSWKAVVACLLVTLVATLCKFLAVSVSSYYASKCHERSAPDSLGYGSLMIGLGLMGLMIVNMAMDAGQYNQTVFTIMVIPGLVSTVLVFPLLDRFYLRRAEIETTGEDVLAGVMRAEDAEPA